MAKKNKNRQRLPQENIGARICKDLILGLVVSTLVCIGLSKLYDLIYQHFASQWLYLPEFNYPELFFTEVSIAFLVISFVTLLANKTETVYWVDVVQYRLVKPNYTSIVDISFYIFANIIISLVAYLIPAWNNLLVFSFVLVIYLLGMLSLKLLMAFFGIEDLKRELEKEYEAALDFRKTVISLYYCDDDLFDDWSDVRSAVTCFFNKPDPDMDDFKDASIVNFNEKAPVADRNLSVEQLYQNIISGKRRPKITNLHILKLYIKLRRYSAKFGGNTNIYADMANSLYENTLNSIEHKQIQKSCEQIFFFFKYKEYERGLSCMAYALKHCPMIFITEFDLLEELDISDSKCIHELNELFVTLKQQPEYQITADCNTLQKAFAYMATISSKAVTSEDLYHQYVQALEGNDHACIDSIYRCFVYTTRKRPYEALFLRRVLVTTEAPNLRNSLADVATGKAKISQEIYATADQWFAKCYHQAIDPTDNTDRKLFELAFEKNDVQAVYILLQAYKNWLEECNSGVVLGSILNNVSDAIARQIKDHCVRTCDLLFVYSQIEQRYRNGQMPAYLFTDCAQCLNECCNLMKQWLGDCAVVQEVKSKIQAPCLAICEKIWQQNETTIAPKYVVRRFWETVNNESQRY